MIHVKGLTKTYTKGKDVKIEALRGITFNLPEGEALAIIGPSGSGKSTILNILGGLDSQYGGSVLIDGQELKDYDPNYYHRHLLGTIFQQFYLVPSLTVEENIALPITFGQQLKKNGAEERLNYLLDRVGLTDRRTHTPSELSGGQAQRVAIARALMTKPAILLADEPTGNLDSKTGHEIIELLFELNKEENTTMMIVTHDTEVIQGVEKKLYLIDGEIKENHDV